MNLRQYKRVVASVKLTEAKINDLSDNSFSFLLLPNNTVLINYHQFTVAIEDCRIKKYSINFIIDPATKEFFSESDIK